MPETLSNALWRRLERSEALVRHLTDLHLMSGMEVLLLNNLGLERRRVPRVLTAPLRRLDAALPRLEGMRTESRQAQLAGESPHPALPWRECIHRIRLEDQTIGYLVLSAWRPEASGDEVARQLWARFAGENSPLSWRAFEEAWLRLPALPPAAVEAWGRHLHMLSETLLHRLQAHDQDPLAIHRLPPMIRQACEIIRREYHRRLTLSEVAAELGLSPEHLSRSFHQASGLPFREYLAEIRIHAVCRDLQDSFDPIAAIAHRHGFATLSRFNRAFLEITGVSPRTWRKRLHARRKVALRGS